MIMANKKKTKKVITKKRKEQAKTDTSNKVLLIIFLILCVVVFVLATINIKINMDDVEKNQSKEYRIQLTNYVDDTINDKIMKYQMELSTSSKKDKVDIELYSSKDNFELLEGKKKVTGLSIKKDKKDKITYTLKLTQRKNPTDKQYVNVKITEDK